MRGILLSKWDRVLQDLVGVVTVWVQPCNRWCHGATWAILDAAASSTPLVGFGSPSSTALDEGAVDLSSSQPTVERDRRESVRWICTTPTP